ncbi:MAG: hypothetical protein ACQESP_10305 [Candidatus Muiribacteriota bacterium]
MKNVLLYDSNTENRKKIKKLINSSDQFYIGADAANIFDFEAVYKEFNFDYVFIIGKNNKLMDKYCNHSNIYFFNIDNCQKKILTFIKNFKT